MPRKEDVVPWSAGMPDEWKRYHWERLGNPEWSAIPIPTPAIGQKIIVFGQVGTPDERNMANYALSVEPDLTTLRVRAVYKYTSENVALGYSHEIGKESQQPAAPFVRFTLDETHAHNQSNNSDPTRGCVCLVRYR